MHVRSLRFLSPPCVALLSVSLFATSGVLAQAEAAPGADPAAAPPAGAEPAAAEPAAAAPADAPAETPAATGADNAQAGAAPADQTLVADAEEGNSPVERAGQTYRFIGLRYRGIVVPKFMMNLFGDGGATVYVNAFGPEFAIRKDGFEYIFSIWYAAYSMDPTPFKASSDEEAAWEIVSSEIKVIYLTADFLWSQDFSPEFALNYGLGAGFGFVFGDLKRTQAYKGPNGDYLPCSAPNNPVTSIGYCDNDNNHYGGFTEPSWANGGSKPIIFPWLVFQTGLRFKPHKHFASRLDLGFGTSGFFFGIGADYGL